MGIAAHLSDHSSSGGGLTLSHDLKDTIREGKELGEGEKERRYNFTPAPPTAGISSSEVNKGKMGKPRMIILIRHAQSEGNKNRDIHQYVPDHRVKLTPDGHTQALDAGKRLRTLLKPDDTIQFFTSPYRRT